MIVAAVAPLRQAWRAVPRIGRCVGIGVLVMTLGASALGLVDSSPTQLATAVQASALPATPPPDPRSSEPRPDSAPQEERPAPPAQLPLAFIENRGQMAPRVGYHLQARDIILSFTPQGLTITLIESGPRPGIIRKTTWDREPIDQDGEAVSLYRLVTLDFVGASPGVRPHGEDPMPITSSQFTGPQPPWQTELSAYATLRYQDVWPGIDLLYTTTGGRLTSTFLVKPGADPNRIQLAYRGVTVVRRTEAGQIEVTTPMGSFSEDAPVAYQESQYLTQLARLRKGMAEEMPAAHQEREERSVAVAVTYTLERSGDISGHGIHVGDYDPNTPLIIDRVVRYPGFIGQPSQLVTDQAVPR